MSDKMKYYLQQVQANEAHTIGMPVGPMWVKISTFVDKANRTFCIQVRETKTQIAVIVEAYNNGTKQLCFQEQAAK